MKSPNNRGIWVPTALLLSSNKTSHTGTGWFHHIKLLDWVFLGNLQINWVIARKIGFSSQINNKATFWRQYPLNTLNIERLSCCPAYLPSVFVTYRMVLCRLPKVKCIFQHSHKACDLQYCPAYKIW